MDASEVIDDRVRPILHDEDPADESYTDAELLRWLNDGMLLIRQSRPDARFDSDQEEVAFAEATGLSDTLVLDDIWRPALTDYVLMRAFSQEAGDRYDADREEKYKRSFGELLVLT